MFRGPDMRSTPRHVRHDGRYLIANAAVVNHLIASCTVSSADNDTLLQVVCILRRSSVAPNAAQSY